MEELEGVLTEIRYQNDVNSYTIGTFETEEYQITVVGYLPFIKKGDYYYEFYRSNSDMF